MDQDIFLLDTGRGSSLQLTANDGWNADPAWSPDGEQLVFVSTMSGSPNLYRTRTDGGPAEAITTGPAQDLQPTWSPDGRLIAFSSRGRDPMTGALGSTHTHANLYVVPAAGGRPVQLTDTPANAWDPAWSPDGSLIAFASDQDGPGASIYLASPASRVIQMLMACSLICSHPAWSPDGAHLVVTVTPTDSPWSTGRASLTIVDRDGGHPRRLIPGDAYDAAWSPDGSWIAFVSERDGHSNLFVVRPDGSGLTQLTHDTARKDRPSWRPGH